MRVLARLAISNSLHRPLRDCLHGCIKSEKNIRLYRVMSLKDCSENIENLHVQPRRSSLASSADGPLKVVPINTLFNGKKCTNDRKKLSGKEEKSAFKTIHTISDDSSFNSKIKITIQKVAAVFLSTHDFYLEEIILGSTWWCEQ